MYFGGLADSLWFAWRLFIEYAHNDLINDFSNYSKKMEKRVFFMILDDFFFNKFSFGGLLASAAVQWLTGFYFWNLMYSCIYMSLNEFLK